ncbi:hypothetical protein SAY86_023415 [Trapa natans]|uniref:Uncharacterized protein n=1 Tax=Trapa natans TaxID=22666 RepID=A0AAN7R9B2_TRANT|nr:hypothetical protein SAY86_023415 [Trapa natans]
MSLESAGRSMLDQPSESTVGTRRRLKISYSREFLLSLSGLEICKKLPSGFDESILSEFQDTYQESQRVPGGFSPHGYNRYNEYGSSPPTRGEPNNYNRGIHGRWDRPSGRSDKDTDSQCSQDSDSGKRYINPSRRGWHAPEHDGLLGSGSFLRPSGYAPGSTGPKFRPNDNYQPNRTTEPYHLPRPYKAVPHQRRENNDSYNDETFGSSESLDEDKAEEERKRRASFELMRKEQQKEFLEKQNSNQEKCRDVFDISTLLEHSEHEKRTFLKNNVVDEEAPPQEFVGDPANSSLSSQALASRPLVPPGFAGAVNERKSNVIEVKTASQIIISRVNDNTMPNNPFEDVELKQAGDMMGLCMKQHENTDIHIILSGESDKKLSQPPDGFIHPLNKEDIFENDHLSDVTGPSSTSERLEVDPAMTAGNQTKVQSSNSSTVLENLFGNICLDASDSNMVLEQHGQEEDPQSPLKMQASRFARWFVDEDEKPSAHPISSRPNELLSLMKNSENSDSVIPDGQDSEKPCKKSLLLSSQLTEGYFGSNTIVAATNISIELFTDGKAGAAPAVLTCEDLENSLMSEMSTSSTKQLQSLQRCNRHEEVNGPDAGVDNHASLHLLSLLQKGTNHRDTSTLNVNLKYSENPCSIKSHMVFNESDNPKEPTNGTLSSSGETSTLETLFGTAFMKELHSVGAPVSSQRGSSSAKFEVVDPQAFSFTQTEANALNNTVALNKRPYSGLEKVNQQFVLDDLQVNLVRPQIHTEERLPEEDGFLALNDPLNLQNLMLGNKPPTKAEGLSSETTPVHIGEELATLNGNLEEFIRGQGPLMDQAPLNKRELDPFRTLHFQQSFPQLHPQQFNPRGANSHLLDSYHGQSNSHMKLMAQEFHGIVMQPSIQHPDTGFSGFDPPNHHNLILQQMQVHGGFPPAQQLQGFMRAPQVLPHVNHQLPGFNHRMNPIQGLHFGLHSQPKFGGIDIQHPAVDIGSGSSHPEALQRLIQTELGNASTSQMNQMASAGGREIHFSQGMHGPKLDMGFPYR